MDNLPSAWRIWYDLVRLIWFTFYSLTLNFLIKPDSQNSEIIRGRGIRSSPPNNLLLEISLIQGNFEIFNLLPRKNCQRQTRATLSFYHIFVVKQLTIIRRALTFETLHSQINKAETVSTIV